MTIQGGSAIPVQVMNPAAAGGDATAANQITEQGFIGALTETAPATDTASSGLNGRLQRIAQRLTSLLALFPASIGQKTAAASFSVTLASDQAALTTKETGAPNIATGQVTAGAAATLVAARATRRTVTISNRDGLIGVYIGPATVTSGNGLFLPALSVVTLPTSALIQVLAASGSPVVSYFEVYD